MQKSQFTRLLLRSGVLALAALAWGAASAEVPSLNAVMAPYDAGANSFFATAGSLSLATSIQIASAMADPRIGDRQSMSVSLKPAQCSYLVRSAAAHGHLIGFSADPPDDNAALRHQRRLLVGYGPVYYDSYYDKPLPMFERQGTRLEEPGCGYVKFSFTF